MIGKVGTVFGKHGVNIASAAVGREPGPGPGGQRRAGHRPPRSDGRDGRLAGARTTSIEEILGLDGFQDGRAVDL